MRHARPCVRQRETFAFKRSNKLPFALVLLSGARCANQPVLPMSHTSGDVLAAPVLLTAHLPKVCSPAAASLEGYSDGNDSSLPERDGTAMLKRAVRGLMR